MLPFHKLLPGQLQKTGASDKVTAINAYRHLTEFCFYLKQNQEEDEDGDGDGDCMSG